MKFLPRRYVFGRCQLRLCCGLPSRDSAALWLWARQRLLGWEHAIHWLFFLPVKSALILWGIDTTGHVIIVESKLDRGQTTQDPFKTLLDFVKSCDDRVWTTRQLRGTWREYFKTAYGVVDRPSPECARITPLIGNISYERAVERAFKLRQATGNPLPTFVSLVASKRAEFSLSEEGQKTLLFLEKLVGSSRVVLRAINATHGTGGLRINSWSPRILTESTRKWLRRSRVNALAGR